MPTQIPPPSERDYDSNAYSPGLFHPVFIHEIYNDRYKVLRKLGFGVYSTVWLVLDIQAAEPHYVAMKVLSAQCYSGQLDIFELEILNQLREADPEHPGHPSIRHLIDAFEHEGPNGNHVCMIFPLMAQALYKFGQMFEPPTVPGNILKKFTKQVLAAIDYAHSQGIIHTDITPNNIMVKLKDEANVQWFLKETERSMERVREIYKLESIEEIPPWDNPCFSLAHFHMGKNPATEDFGELDVALADWGVACWDDQHLTEEVYPEVLRAPELLIGAPWDSKVDIWALGCILLELLENRRMFFAEMPDENDDLQYEPWWHFCEINKLCGPFPKKLLERGDPSLVARAFDEQGMIMHHREARREGLEAWVEHLKGKEMENFISMIKSMLEIDPDKRKSAKELLNELWLTEDHFEDFRANAEAKVGEDRGSPAVDREAADPADGSSKEADTEVSKADDQKGVA